MLACFSKSLKYVLNWSTVQQWRPQKFAVVGISTAKCLAYNVINVFVKKYNSYGLII